MPVKPSQPLPQVDWPQDHLQVPSGNGQLAPVNARNKDVTKSEFFVVSGMFTGWDGASTRTLNIPAPKDGDFWITGICCLGFNSLSQNDFRIHFDIRVTDIMTDYDLFNPSIPYGMLRVPLDTITNPTQPFFRSIENMPAPYPLLRGGGLRVTCSPSLTVTLSTPWQMYFAFTGWKEYAYAAI